jgi:hypothetical protein
VIKDKLIDTAAVKITAITAICIMISISDTSFFTNQRNTPQVYSKNHFNTQGTNYAEYKSASSHTSTNMDNGKISSSSSLTITPTSIFSQR